MIQYRPDHIHLLASDVIEVARWYRDNLGAEIVESIQSDGKPRIDLRFGGLTIYLGEARTVEKWLGEKLGPPRSSSMLGLDHFGLAVDDVDAAVDELESKGVRGTFRPASIRPGCRAAFIAAPDGVSIELVYRDPATDFQPAIYRQVA